MHLLRSLELAQREKFVLGVKLVRGAYHPQEHKVTSPYEPDPTLIQRRLASISTDDSLTGILPGVRAGPAPPVWDEKWETDGAYNAAALLLVDLLARKDSPVPASTCLYA